MPVSPERTWTRSQSWFAIHKPRPAILVGARPFAPHQRVVDATGIADGADQIAVFVPDVEPARAAAVLDAVGGDLADREDEVLVAAAVEPGRAGALGDEVAHHRQVRPAEVEPDRGPRGLRQRPFQRRIERVAGGDRLAVGMGADGMAALGALQDLVAEPPGVVRAHHGQRALRSEGEVEKPLMQLALFQLGGAAVRRDRFAQTADTPVEVAGVEEVPPGRDQPRGVASHVAHRPELHRFRIGSQGFLDELHARLREDDQDRLSGSDPLFQVGDGPL